MVWMRLTQVRFRIDSLNSHESHQFLYSLSVDKIAFSPQCLSHPPGTIKGSLGILFIDGMVSAQGCMDPWLAHNTLSNELFQAVQPAFSPVWSHLRTR